MLKYSDDINMRITNMQVKKTPLVLYNTLFKVTKEVTDVEGYWLDNDKVYFDYIIPVNYNVIDSYNFRLAVKRAFDEGEICVFYKNFYNKGVLTWKSGKKEILPNRYEEISQTKPDEEYIKILLEEFGGLTLYKLAGNCYVIEIYNLNYGGSKS